MPIVDYNRIYRVRSQERKPITNPVTGPDAAGAFLRGAVPAALAPMHGLNARIDAIRGETNARNRRDALRLDGIASGIRAAGDAYQAYIRAMERRDAAELDKLEAAYTSYMVSGSDAAFSKPRKTEDGKVTDGPGAAIRQLDKDFEETDAYKAANRRVKDAFSPRREARRAVYFAKGDRAQFEAARTEHAQAVKDRAESDDVAVSKNLDPYNYRAWKEMTEIAIESDQHRLRLETGKFDVDADGREIQRKPLTQEELRKLEDKRIEKRDAYILQRAAYYGNLIAQDDGTLALTPHLEAVLEAIANNTGLSGGGQVEDDGMPDSDIAFANETVTDPLIRMQIGGILANARQQRERNVAAKDSRTAQQASDMILLVENGELPDERLEASVAENGGIALGIREEIQRTVSGITKPGLQAKLLDDADAAIATRKAINWLTRYNADGADRTAMLEEHSKMPDGREKDILTRQLFGGGSGERWTSTNANNLLSAGAKPAAVMDLAMQKFEACELDSDGFRRVQDAVRAKMNFDRLTTDENGGSHAGEWMEQIVGAVDDAFGVRIGDILAIDPVTKLPRCDKDGNPIPAKKFDPDNTRQSTVGRRTRIDYDPIYGAQETETNPGLRIADSTMLDAVRLGMQFVSQRIAGFDGKGKKSSDPAPAIPTIRAELAEYFKTVLASKGDDLKREKLAQVILDARERAAQLNVAPSLRRTMDEAFVERNGLTPDDIIR